MEDKKDDDLYQKPPSLFQMITNFGNILKRVPLM